MSADVSDGVVAAVAFSRTGQPQSNHKTVILGRQSVWTPRRVRLIDRDVNAGFPAIDVSVVSLCRDVVGETPEAKVAQQDVVDRQEAEEDVHLKLIQRLTTRTNDSWPNKSC